MNEWIFAKRYRNGINSQEQPNQYSSIIKYFCFQCAMHACQYSKICTELSQKHKAKDNVRHKMGGKNRQHQQPNQLWPVQVISFIFSKQSETKLSKRLTAYFTKWINSKRSPFACVHNANCTLHMHMITQAIFMVSHFFLFDRMVGLIFMGGKGPVEFTAPSSGISFKTMAFFCLCARNQNSQVS